METKPTTGAMRPRHQRPEAQTASLTSSPKNAATKSPTAMRGTARMADRDDTRRQDDPRVYTRSTTGVSSFRTGSNAARSGSLGPSPGSFLGDSWASVTDYATSLFSSSPQDANGLYTSGSWISRSRSQGGHVSRHKSKKSSTTPITWGPEPPEQSVSRGRSRRTMDDVAAGSRAEMEAALTAARRATVLESHEGVNGGLDVSGKFKHRNSDELTRPDIDDSEVEDQLVYIHYVAPSDTLAGLVLKYHCREDILKKANGMWSNDVQLRKRLFLPVDACRVKGKVCDPPPVAEEVSETKTLAEREEIRQRKQQQEIDDFFMSRTSTSASASTETSPTTDSLSYTQENPDKPWQHVRWVALENFTSPIEIGRMSKKALGYFPPRRKKSIHTVSSLSTPRQSFDASTPGSIPNSSTPNTRRPSLLSARPGLSVTSPITANAYHTRGASGGEETLPVWMRKAGGVGSLSVRAPGPANDILNKWAKKHIPGLSMEAVPSMAIMGSETASLGISRDVPGVLANGPSATAGVGGATSDDFSRSLHSAGTNLDRMAAAVETWVRGALAKTDISPRAVKRGARGSVGSSSGAGINGNATDGDGAVGSSDFIELGDNLSDDGQPPVFSLDYRKSADRSGERAVSGSGMVSRPGAVGSGEMRARRGGKKGNEES
ncbi:LysM domain-containing protein [Ceratocystis lukuohia]|uniref:LysM domain-containing protein n=1 Tax=Ceratocystis lukuohia TaxID=2019550 RepID=A0ABR4MLX9_9PEZI